MAKKSSEFFSVDLSNGRRFSFRSIDEIESWISQQKSFWDWFLRPRFELGPGVENLRMSYVNAFNNMNTRLNEWRQKPQDEAAASRLHAVIQQTYEGTSKIVLADHPWATSAKQIADSNVIAGASALATFADVPVEVDSRSAVEGIVEAILARDGISKKSPQLVFQTISKFVGEGEQKIKQGVDEWRRLSDEASRSTEASNSASAQQRKELAQQWFTLSERINRGVEAAVQSIQKTENTYKEQMHLQAAVDYWTSKADVHRKAERASRRLLVRYTLIAPLGLIAFLVGLSVAVGVMGSADTGAYIKFGAIGAIATTIALWIARVLLRIFLSERHLLTDAEERITMIKTYLALANESKVDAADRALVLAPLFRSAADGIVKEEGPDASLAGIIARAVDIKSRG
jgi:hypothetical protein